MKMTITDQIKLLNKKNMQNDAQYDLDRKAAKISALSSNNLDKYEYLTGEDLRLKPSTIEQAKFEYSPLGKIFNKGLDKYDEKEGLLKRLKNIEDKNEEQLKLPSNTNKTSSYIKSESDYNYDNNCAFYKFYRDFQNIKDSSLKSKYNDTSKFYKTLNEFKNHKTNIDKTQQRKNKVINSTVTLYNNYFDSYKKAFNETRNETFDKTTLDDYDPYKFKIESLLPEWLESKNDFNEAKKLIDDIEVDINKVKVSKEDKKVFNDLNKLIIDINNNKVKKEDAVERLNKSISDLDQLKQKQSTVLRNKMVQVVYQLFNSFGFNKEFAPLFSQIKSEQTEEKMQKPWWFKINKPEFEELTSDIYDNQNNKDFKITINKKTYDLKNAKKFWTKITKSKISKNETEKLYKELIQKDFDARKREKSNSTKKNNI